MRVQCESKPELIDTKNFWENKKIGTKKFKTEIIKNSVNIFAKNELIDNEKFENDFLKVFGENVKFVGLKNVFF